MLHAVGQHRRASEAPERLAPLTRAPAVADTTPLSPPWHCRVQADQLGRWGRCHLEDPRARVRVEAVEPEPGKRWHRVRRARPFGETLVMKTA